MASSSLNIGPHVAMNIAERLYTAGLISYPRTESSAYSASFDFRAVLREHRGHPVWGEYSGALLSSGFADPKVACAFLCGDSMPMLPLLVPLNSNSVLQRLCNCSLGFIFPDCTPFSCIFPYED